MLRRFLGLGVALWAGGLLAFAATVPGAMDWVGSGTPVRPPPKADAVVVFTGPEMARLAVAFRLLDTGTAPLLLISGVWEGNNETTLRGHVGLPPHGACCVSIDHAHNTRENALLTADWVVRREVRSLLLVTSDYHMPRAEWLLHMTLPPGVTVQTLPVPTGERLPMRIFVEYHRFLGQIVLEELGKL